jgi:hypothetical protein
MKFSRRGPPDITPSQELCTLCIHVVYMATLYWRHKKNGKWTWSRVVPHEDSSMKEVIKELIDYNMILPLEEEQ